MFGLMFKAVSHHFNASWGRSRNMCKWAACMAALALKASFKPQRLAFSNWVNADSYCLR
ncbi:MAG: hypothetical protein D6675_09800 [Gemmatimonadetes bacterium]|nr:MAG: hypothetical protein D6675_09800 [Gemmatimonadota bacterium]